MNRSTYHLKSHETAYTNFLQCIAIRVADRMNHPKPLVKRAMIAQRNKPCD